MKSKIKKHGDSKTIMIDYSRLIKMKEFRYEMQYNLLKELDKEVFLMIDTNACTSKSDMRISAMFDEAGIEYVSYKVKEIQKGVMGSLTGMFKKNQPKMSKRMYIAKVDKDNYTKEIFMQALSVYDIGFGIGPKKTMEELKDDFHDEIFDTYFDDEYYDDFVYDSIMFNIFRTTIDVSDDVAQIEASI